MSDRPCACIECRGIQPNPLAGRQPGNNFGAGSGAGISMSPLLRTRGDNLSQSAPHLHQLSDRRFPPQSVFQQQQLCWCGRPPINQFARIHLQPPMLPAPRAEGMTQPHAEMHPAMAGCCSAAEPMVYYKHRPQCACYQCQSSATPPPDPCFLCATAAVPQHRLEALFHQQQQHVQQHQMQQQHNQMQQQQNQMQQQQNQMQQHAQQTTLQQRQQRYAPSTNHESYNSSSAAHHIHYQLLQLARRQSQLQSNMSLPMQQEFNPTYMQPLQAPWLMSSEASQPCGQQPRFYAPPPPPGTPPFNNGGQQQQSQQTSMQQSASRWAFSRRRNLSAGSSSTQQRSGGDAAAMHAGGQQHGGGLLMFAPTVSAGNRPVSTSWTPSKHNGQGAQQMYAPMAVFDDDDIEPL